MYIATNYTGIINKEVFSTEIKIHILYIIHLILLII
jgi:hypothetical protein